MCGIVGYVGKKNCATVLMKSLKRLEYRGYDSAGIAVLTGSDMVVHKAAGKISVLERMLKGERLKAFTGIAHTRWATHGEPTSENAHPHVDCSGKIAVAHNGIIENHAVLRRMLEAEGHEFHTDTDTEVLPHLIEKFYDGNLERAVGQALQMVEGTYGIAVICSHEPDKMVGAKNGSPLLVGVNKDEFLVASDAAAVLSRTKQVVYLDDKEMAVISSDGFATSTIDHQAVDKRVEKIEWDLAAVEKAGFRHFMLKEIFEQPQAVGDAMRGRVLQEEGTAKLGGLNMGEKELRAIDRVIITACGTSWHAGMIGEYMLEDRARIPVEVEYASEFRYRNPVVRPGTMVIVISQSGETADTLAAMREAKRKGARALGICNVVGSTIARESDGGVYVHAGPEIGVASTKAFTSQITVLGILTLCLGRLRMLSKDEGGEMANALLAIPNKIGKILERNDQVIEIAKQYYKHNNFLYLGRGVNFPVALEGALKLKEISYIHAEGYPAAEMKHGPIALIDESMPVVFICTKDSAYEKILSNMAEVRARKGKIITVATEGDEEILSHADHVIHVPATLEFLTPLLTVVPLQLLAYHMAVMRGCDVDQPRNLAKSVTVE